MSYLTALLGAGLLGLLLAVWLIKSRFGDGEALLAFVAGLDGGDWARAMVAEVEALPPGRRRSFARGCAGALLAERLWPPPVLPFIAAMLLAVFNFPWPGLIDPSPGDPFHWSVGQLNDLVPLLAVGASGWLSRTWLGVLAATAWTALLTGIGLLAAVAFLALVMAGGDFGPDVWFSVGIALPGGAATGLLIGALGGVAGHLARKLVSLRTEPDVSSS